MMITIDEILESVTEYNPQADILLIKKSFEFSAKAHAGQKRKSGEPYLIHPLEVAKILTVLKMDIASIVSAILHDTIEDTIATKEDIEKGFGTEIADIVDGVTKISKIQFSTQHDRQAENYRKMILAMSKDIRVIMVKLADRLNNMRTLQFMSESKQVQISQETLDIYAPIAGRMGIYWIKEELEELALKFLKPDVFQQIQARTSRFAKNRETYITRVIATVRENLSESTIQNCDITGRIKKPYSIYRKMQNSEVSLDGIHDLIAFRIHVDSIEQCYEALGLIHSLWKPIQGRFKDYIAMPKANNYQSLHTTVMCFDGERVEFQIRTHEMHEIAEKGIAAHWKYKSDGGIDTKDEAKFNWLRQLVDWQKELSDSIDFVDTVKMDLFEDEIFVFTPKGEIKRLNQNATPVDFAYAIHSAVGHQCAGARVNNRLVPLSYRLESGDTVEIVTNKSQKPNKDWLDFVTTSKAITHVRQFIRQEQREKSLLVGKSLLESATMRRKISLSNFLKSPEFQKLLQDEKYDDLDSFYIDLAFGRLNAREVIERIFPATPASDNQSETPNANSVVSRLISKVTGRNKNLVLVDQQGDVLVSFGKCCSPVKGDAIIGYVTRGRGIAVHRIDCPRLLNIDPDLRVAVDWNRQSDQISIARLMIVTEDRKGILADVTKAISEKNVNISKVVVNTRDQAGVARLLFDICVHDLDELRRVIIAIEKLKSVVKVIRQ